MIGSAGVVASMLGTIAPLDALMTPMTCASRPALATRFRAADASSLFSMTTGLPRRSAMPSARYLPKMSAGPPGGKGTIIVSGLLGKARCCAQAGAADKEASPASALRRVIMRGVLRFADLLFELDVCELDHAGPLLDFLALKLGEFVGGSANHDATDCGVGVGQFFRLQRFCCRVVDSVEIGARCGMGRGETVPVV